MLRCSSLTVQWIFLWSMELVRRWIQLWQQLATTEIHLDSAFAVNQGHVNIKDKIITTTDHSETTL